MNGCFKLLNINKKNIYKILQNAVTDREMEVKEIFENFTNLEGSPDTSLGVELQVRNPGILS